MSFGEYRNTFQQYEARIAVLEAVLRECAPYVEADASQAGKHLWKACRSPDHMQCDQCGMTLRDDDMFLYPTCEKAKPNVARALATKITTTLAAVPMTGETK